MIRDTNIRHQISDSMFGGAYKSHNQFATRLFTRLFARGEPSQIKLEIKKCFHVHNFQENGNL